MAAALAAAVVVAAAAIAAAIATAALPRACAGPASSARRTRRALSPSPWAAPLLVLMPALGAAAFAAAPHFL